MANIIEIVTFHMPPEIVLIDVTFAADGALKRTVLVFVMSSDVEF